MPWYVPPLSLQALKELVLDSLWTWKQLKVRLADGVWFGSGRVGSVGSVFNMENLSPIRVSLPQSGEEWIEKITFDVLDYIFVLLDVNSLIKLGMVCYMPPSCGQAQVAALTYTLYRPS